MVYIPSQNTFLVEIPKAGSRSLVHQVYHRNSADMAVRGHHPVSVMIDRARKQVGIKPEPTVIAVIRDPVERFISAMNFYFTEIRLDEAMSLVLRNGVTFNAPFQRQRYFLDDPGEPINLYLYPIEKIDEVFARIGVEPTVQNAKRYRWKAEQIKEHPLFPEIMNAYQADYKARDVAWQTQPQESGQEKQSVSPSLRRRPRARSQQKSQTLLAAE